ncbi:Multidrug resistance protein MdtK [Phycisphaerales bacterium]|nr:Multidrug resistance protein MdtK [Phycisphaerales bacterium]
MSTESHSTPAKNPLREVLAIAAPTVATMTSYTLMTFVDKWLVSQIGPEPVYVGAQGNGGLAAWVPISIAQGTLTIINTYVSQNLGAGRPERGPAYAWNGVWIATAWWLFILVPYSFLLPSIFRLAGMDAEQARLGAVYGQILLWGSCLTMATRCLSQFFYGMHRAGVVLAAGIAANVVNLALSYVLVFGVLGFPKLGVAGSAIGTVFATLIELAIPIAVFLGREFNSKYGTRRQWRLSVSHWRDLLRLGWPGGVMFGNEMVCWGIFMVYLVSHFGRVHATAGWIAHQYMSLSFMPAVGLSMACTALVGKYQGMGRPDLAAHRAWLCVRAAVVYMGLCGLAFIVFRRQLVGVFIPAEADPATVATLVRLGSAFLIATAAFQLFDAGAMTISGALRGAGDTVAPGVATIFMSWTIIVGGGFALVWLAPGLESLGPWIAAAVYIFALCVFLLVRFLGGKWRSIKIVKDETALDTVEATQAGAAATDGVV